jgi:hypothetical protein
VLSRRTQVAWAAVSGSPGVAARGLADSRDEDGINAFHARDDDHRRRGSQLIPDSEDAIQLRDADIVDDARIRSRILPGACTTSARPWPRFAAGI